MYLGFARRAKGLCDARLTVDEESRCGLGEDRDVGRGDFLGLDVDRLVTCFWGSVTFECEVFSVWELADLSSEGFIAHANLILQARGFGGSGDVTGAGATAAGGAG